jgi:hypothetical protein
MAVTYFNKFPTTLYDIEGNKQQKLVIDIIHRANFIQSVLANIAVYYPYTITDGDTPEIIAAKYYGNSNYNWVILAANNIINPYYDWPLTYQQFQATMNSLFGDLRIAKRTIYNYLDQYGNIIDQITYNSLVANQRSSITVYDYYFNLNESKRNIIIPDKTYLLQIDSNMNKLLSGLSN